MAIHAMSLLARKRFSVFDPLVLFWGGCLVVYVYQPIAFRSQLENWYSATSLESTSIYVIFGLFAVSLGYELRIWRFFYRMLPKGPASIDWRKIQSGGLLLILAGAGGLVYEFTSAGGAQAWASASRGGTDWQQISGYVGALTALLPFGIFLYALSVEARQVKGMRRIAPWLLMILLLVWFAYLGTRSRFIATILSGLMAYYLPRKQNPSIVVCATIFSFLLFFSSFLGIYRERFTDFSFNLTDTSLGQIWAEVSSTDSNHNQQLISRGMEFSSTVAVIENVPKTIDYAYGYPLLEFASRPIPRSLWPSKRYPHYEAFTPIYQHAHLSDHWIEGVTIPILAGPAFTFVGHWFAVGGPIALMIAGILTGGLFRSIKKLYDNSEVQDGKLPVFAVLTSIGLAEAISTPLFWIFNIPLILIPILAILSFARVRIKANR
jgi:oligosaccharide repeat unit polymerase